VNPPEKVMTELLFSWPGEAHCSTARWVDTTEYAAGSGVLSAAVRSQQDDQQGPSALGEQPLLQDAHAAEVVGCRLLDVCSRSVGIETGIVAVNTGQMVELARQCFEAFDVEFAHALPSLLIGKLLHTLY
jgi:hypothetical protein